MCQNNNWLINWVKNILEQENVETEMIDAEEYSLDLDLKIRHARKFVQYIQTPNDTSLELSFDNCRKPKPSD